MSPSILKSAIWIFDIVSFGILLFDILSFDILSFDILLFDILLFDILLFDILSFDILSFDILDFDKKAVHTGQAGVRKVSALMYCESFYWRKPLFTFSIVTFYSR
jgi:hypothetical protein